MLKPRLVPRLADWVDDRLGAAKVVRKTALDKIFPDHWSFMLGELALYCFVILSCTGVFLTFFFKASPDSRRSTTGRYAPLQGVEMSAAYESAIRLSFDVRAGIVMRQAHHWAALIFLGDDLRPPAAGCSSPARSAGPARSTGSSASRC